MPQEGRSQMAVAPVPAPETVPAADQARTIAHLASTVLSALGHVSRHAAAAQHPDSPASRDFNLRHAVSHVGEAVEHQRKLISVLAAYHPEVGAELGKLRVVTDPGSTAPVPDRSAEPADYDVMEPDRGALLFPVRSAAPADYDILAPSRWLAGHGPWPA